MAHVELLIDSYNFHKQTWKIREIVTCLASKKRMPKKYWSFVWKIKNTDVLYDIYPTDPTLIKCRKMVLDGVLKHAPIPVQLQIKKYLPLNACEMVPYGSF